VLPAEIVSALKEATKRAGELRSLLPPQLSDAFEQERNDIVDAHYRSFRTRSTHFSQNTNSVLQEIEKTYKRAPIGRSYAYAVEDVLRGEGLYS
jgi:hypothetical protein